MALYSSINPGGLVVSHLKMNGLRMGWGGWVGWYATGYCPVENDARCVEKTTTLRTQAEPIRTMKLAINSRNVCGPKAFNPWAQFEQDVNRLFGTPWALVAGDPGEVGVPGFVPALEVQEKADRYTVVLDLPGVRKEDVQVSFQAGLLTLAGERKAEQEVAETTWHRRERRFGRFERRLELPTEVQADAIAATFKDGVLTIALPKAEAAKARQVEIRAE